MSKPRCVSNKGQLLAAAQIYLLSLKSFVAVHWRYACIILCLLCEQYSVIDTGMARLLVAVLLKECILVFLCRGLLHRAHCYFRRDIGLFVYS